MKDNSMPLSLRAGLALDRALSLFAPAHALARMDARLRMYSAARPTDDKGGWIPYDGDVNSLIRTSSQPVRARVRQLVRDFPYAKRAIRVRTALIIGNKGMRLQGKLRTDDGKRDRETNALLESVFAEWAEHADLSGRMSFADLQALAERQLFECGEYFFIKRFLRGKKNPFRLQPIEADRLPFTGGTGARLADGCAMENGIEYRKDTGEPVAYHFQDDGYSAKTVRVPADLVIHGYEVERPGQMRGISPIAASVLIAKDLLDLIEAELNAMKMASRFLAFVSNQYQNAPLQNVSAKTREKGKVFEDLGRSTIQYLVNGDQVHLAKIDRQAGTFEPYLNFNIRTFAIGCGLTFELVSGAYNHISFSNLRGIRLDLAKTLLPIQQNHINWLCTPSSAACFEAAMLAGHPDIARIGRPITRRDYTWIPPGQESVDALRDVKAVVEENRLKVTSLREITAMKGRDWLEVLEEIKEEEETIEELGLTFKANDTSLKTNPAAVMEEKTNA
jgi:lambda family phage portal protein